jgi:hypothetical protein
MWWDIKDDEQKINNISLTLIAIFLLIYGCIGEKNNQDDKQKQRNKEGEQYEDAKNQVATTRI